jgi:hypothetical protein
MKFKEITKKQFKEDLCASDVMFINGGFTKKENSVTTNELRNDKIKVCCEVIGSSRAEYVGKCTPTSQGLKRVTEDGGYSYLTLDKHTKCYNYGNIYVAESTYEDSERINQVIYLAV